MNPSLTTWWQRTRASTGSAPKLDVAIIYECPDTGRRAKRLSDQLAAELPLEGALKLNRWNFGVLGTRQIRNEAASTAAAADLVILSMDGRVPLPAKVKKWIELWTWLIDGHRPAVVALLAAPAVQSAPVQAYLRRETASKKLDFFPQPNCAAAETEIIRSAVPAAEWEARRQYRSTGDTMIRQGFMDARADADADANHSARDKKKKPTPLEGNHTYE